VDAIAHADCRTEGARMTGTDTRKDRARQAAAADRHTCGEVSVGDVVVRYDDRGTGDPIVLVHGHPFDGSMWWPQVEWLARGGWRVIVPDLRGYGQSPLPRGADRSAKTTLDVFADDIRAVVDQLGLDRFVLGGLSMGGQIVMEFYRRFPDRIRALVLADTAATAESADGRRVRNDTADRVLDEGMASYAEDLLPMMLAPTSIRLLPGVADHVSAMMRRTSPSGAAAALRGRAERPDYRDLLRTVDVPTLVLVGDGDVFTPQPVAEEIEDLVPGATLTTIRDAGHLPNLERPAEFNAAVEEFLGGLGAEPAAVRR
jgi:pimeloyl-ACP methyl ester carboxylesterase